MWLQTGIFFLLFVLFTASGIHLLIKKKDKNKYITAMGTAFLLLGIFILIINLTLLFN